MKSNEFLNIISTIYGTNEHIISSYEQEVLW